MSAILWILAWAVVVLLILAFNRGAHVVSDFDYEEHTK